jgi:hypothetical protein
MPLIEGQTILSGECRIIRLIGEGAFARVAGAGAGLREPAYGRQSLPWELLDEAELRRQQRRCGRELGIRVTGCSGWLAEAAPFGRTEPVHG